MTEQEVIRQAMKLLGARGGRVGGRSKSPAKMAAMELNLAKARAVRRERARTKTILHVIEKWARPGSTRECCYPR